MLVPLSWLREFVPVELEPDALAERLSLTGFAVEQVISVGGTVSGVVVGEVKSVREHPDADNLMLVVASDGTAEHHIVCGARNYAPGDRVPMALPGAKLPNGMEIGARTVRGEPSNGMLCSAKELGVGDDHSGILLLDADMPLGADLTDAAGIDDVVFEVEVTPNRPDAMSIVGIAREVAAITGAPLTVPTPIVPAGEGDPGATVTVRDKRGCPRYLGRVITGVSTGRSPWWMRRRLLAAGMRPISTIVDVTNYVLLERGQPLHAFDLDRLAGGAIVVRKPRAAEQRFTTLDDEERELDREDVLICDAERPVAIGGIMGGADSEVSAGTTAVLLESAAFDPARIARTARRLGLRTEASQRFERGTDREAIGTAADRATELLIELTGATVQGPPIDVAARAPRRKAVRLRRARAASIIGVEHSVEDMAATLERLGCDVTATKSTVRAVPPSWRGDLAAEEDLIEEVARIAGYDTVPSTLPDGARRGGLSIEQERRRTAAHALRGAGLSEAYALSLIPPKMPELLALGDDHPWRATRRLVNPLSEEESVLRPSLIPGLLLAASHNASRRALPVRLYELGTTFAATADGVAETERIAFVLTGSAPASWHGDDRPLDFFDGRGVLDALTASLGVSVSVSATDLPGWPVHPGRTARVDIDGTEAGVLAELHPRVADALDLPERVTVCELALSPLIAARPTADAPEVPRFPPVARDIAVIAPDDVPAADVAEVIMTAGGEVLDRVRLFDVYAGAPIPDGSRSLAYALTLRAADRTLTDEDADGTMGRVTAAIRDRGWSIRD